MSHERNRVCKEHKEFSKDCSICQLEATRNQMALTFWYISKCAEGPYLSGPRMYVSEPPPPKIATNEEAMKLRLDHIVEVASDMMEQYGTVGLKRFADFWDKNSHPRP